MTTTTSLELLPAALKALRKVWKLHAASSSASTKLLQQHIEHCWSTLAQLHTSLQAGLDCLEYSILPRMIASTTSTKQIRIIDWLPIWFQYIIRLHDGFIYCISGECRCLYDQQHLHPIYKSYLSQNTTTYHNIYSGTSWDEFNDSQYGLLQRYLQSIHNKTIQWWENTIYERYPVIELFWNQIEVEQQQFQQRFQEWQITSTNTTTNATTTKWTRILTQYNSTTTTTSMVQKLHIVLTDKMEQMKFQYQGKQYYYQRMSTTTSTTTLNNKEESILPIQWNKPSDWESTFSTWNQKLLFESSSSLQLLLSNPIKSDPSTTTTTTTTSNHHRRRIRIRDDEEQEQQTNHEIESSKQQQQQSAKDTKKQKTRPEWKVRIEEDTTTPPSSYNTTSKDLSSKLLLSSSSLHSDTTSVLALKEQFGIDPKQLEESHAFVQAEETKTRKEGQRIDQDLNVLVMEQQQQDDQDDHVAEQTLVTTQLRLQQYQAMLEELLDKTENDPNNNDNDDDLLWNAREHVRQMAMELGNLCLWYPKRLDIHLKKALQAFQLAQNMVQAQTVDPTEPFFYQHTLCLVLGQAQTNIGIVYVEQHKYRLAISQLQIARSTTQQLLSELSSHQQEQETTTTTTRMIYETWQLFVLTMRWCGVAYWHLHRCEKAQSCWNEAVSCLVSIQTFTTNGLDPNQDGYSALVKECITTYMVWSDMCTQELEHMTNLMDATTMYTAAQDALHKAIELSQQLLYTQSQSRQGNDTNAEEENDTHHHHPTTLQQAATELEHWWKARSDAWQVTLGASSKTKTSTTTERSDLTANTIVPLGPPTRRLVWKPQSQKRKKSKQKRQNTSSTYSIVLDDTTTTSNTQQNNVIVLERPWGDDLFPKSPNGTPQLPLLCGPPPLDPELALQAQRCGIKLP